MSTPFNDPTSAPASTAFWATIEYTNPGEALVTVQDGCGEFVAGGRVQVRSGQRQDLYEEGYRLACITAASHGGRLERYKVKGGAWA